MKKVLLTGASGFIGRHAIRGFLEEGYEVHCTSRTEAIDPSLRELGAEWHAVDLLREDDLRRLLSELRPTDLLHLAWYAEPGAFWSAEANLDWVSASLQLLRQFADHGGKRATLAGSCVEYDWTFGTLHERTTPLGSGTLYGSCKNGLREIGESYCSMRGIDLAWGRVFFLYGKYEHPSRTGALPDPAAPGGKGGGYAPMGSRPRFPNSEGCGRGLRALSFSGVNGEVNIGSGSAIRVRAIAKMIGKKIGRPDLIKLGALPRRVNDPPLVVADNARLRDEVGWRAARDLDQGLDEVIAWWRTRRDDQGGDPCN